MGLVTHISETQPDALEKFRALSAKYNNLERVYFDGRDTLLIYPSDYGSKGGVDSWEVMLPEDPFSSQLSWLSINYALLRNPHNIVVADDGSIRHDEERCEVDAVRRGLEMTLGGLRLLRALMDVEPVNVEPVTKFTETEHPIVSYYGRPTDKQYELASHYIEVLQGILEPEVTPNERSQE